MSLIMKDANIKGFPKVILYNEDQVNLHNFTYSNTLLGERLRQYGYSINRHWIAQTQHIASQLANQRVIRRRFRWVILNYDQQFRDFIATVLACKAEFVWANN